MIAVLMTDGRPTMGTVDSSDIIARFSKANQNGLSVFTLSGRGTASTRSCWTCSATTTAWGSWPAPLREQIPAAVKRAARELSRPVLANLEYRFSSDSAAEVYPGTLTHLFLDRPLRPARPLPPGPEVRRPTDRRRIRRAAPRHGVRPRLRASIEARDGGEGLRREWVAQKIYKLINDHLAAGRAETVQEIRDLPSGTIRKPLPYGADFPL